jgi:membrane fusion protein (multidrug efflux system)
MLVVDPSEQLLPRIKVGQNAKVNVDAVQAAELEATVRKINPSVDPASGTIKVTLDFDPATKTKLRDQAFARVRLIMETREDALLVPKDSIIEENARKYVFVVNDLPADPVERPEAGGGSPERVQVADRVEVETGLEDNAFTEIVSGLEDSVLVITVGQQTLKPGAEVKVTSASDEIVAKAELSAEDALAAAKAERAKGATTRNRDVDF